MNNVIIYIVIAVLLFISAASKAVMDQIHSCICNTIFKKWEGHRWVDPAVSWLNKYKGNDPKNGEKFFLSTTILVFTTDLWHFAQFIFLRTFFAVPIIYSFCHPIVSWWADYLIMSVFFGISFELTYKLVGKK